MPGPMSAPNGEYSLTTMTGMGRVEKAQARKLYTGKTALKRGKIEHNQVRSFREKTARAKADQARQEREANNGHS